MSLFTARSSSRHSTNTPAAPRSSAVRLEQRGEEALLLLSGRLDSAGVAEVWTPALALVREVKTALLTADLGEVEWLDGAGAALITELRLIAAAAAPPVAFSVRGLAPEFEPLLDRFSHWEPAPAATGAQAKLGFISEMGREGLHIWEDVKGLIGFVGETSAALGAAVSNPRSVRWKDVISVCETAGVNALPIVALIGFLMGLIMSFQSAVPLQRFAADIFVADMLVISLTRELGPLVTAILLAGRSGSSFAAEIGTMKVNEEVDALTTMGLDPVRFLTVPRILAAVFMTPLLIIFFNLFGLIGGAFVLKGFGYPLVTYILRVQGAAKLVDILGGLFKGLVFSLLVAAIGCRRGLTTGIGASAVGASTTSSVVSGLVLIAVADGVLAVIFYALKL